MDLNSDSIESRTLTWIVENEAEYGATAIQWVEAPAFRAALLELRTAGLVTFEERSFKNARTTSDGYREYQGLVDDRGTSGRGHDLALLPGYSHTFTSTEANYTVEFHVDSDGEYVMEVVSVGDDPYEGGDPLIRLNLPGDSMLFDDDGGAFLDSRLESYLSAGDYVLDVEDLNGAGHEMIVSICLIRGPCVTG